MNGSWATKSPHPRMIINRLMSILPTRCVRSLPSLLVNDRLLVSQCASSWFSSSGSGSGSGGNQPTRKKAPRAANPNLYRMLFQQQAMENKRLQEEKKRGVKYRQHRSSIQRTPKKPRLPKASNPMFFRTSFLEEQQKNRKQKSEHSPSSSGYFKIKKTLSFRSIANEHVRFQYQRSKSRSTPSYRTRESHDRNTEHATGEIKTVADYLKRHGESIYTRPESTWIRIDNISPISSLEFMIKGIDAALDAEESNGIIDLDQNWQGEENVSFLPPMPWIENKPKWVRNARLILSPFSRPKGWFMQFDNRSIVHALVSHASRSPIQCAYKRVQVSVCRVEPVQKPTEPSDESSPTVRNGPIEYVPINEDPNSLLDETISDHTIRVENCPSFATVMSIVNFFSRYDLQNDKESVKKWFARTTDGRTGKRTFLVHFADAHWARAALRERQSMFLPLFNADTVFDESMGPLLLAQYPKQMW